MLNFSSVFVVLEDFGKSLGGLEGFTILKKKIRNYFKQKKKKKSLNSLFWQHILNIYMSICFHGL